MLFFYKNCKLVENVVIHRTFPSIKRLFSHLQMLVRKYLFHITWKYSSIIIQLMRSSIYIVYGKLYSYFSLFNTLLNLLLLIWKSHSRADGRDLS